MSDKEGQQDLVLELGCKSSDYVRGSQSACKAKEEPGPAVPEAVQDGFFTRVPRYRSVLEEAART